VTWCDAVQLLEIEAEQLSQVGKLWSWAPL
jgi:hypothetical protein